MKEKNDVPCLFIEFVPFLFSVMPQWAKSVSIRRAFFENIVLRMSVNDSYYCPNNKINCNCKIGIYHESACDIILNAHGLKLSLRVIFRTIYPKLQRIYAQNGLFLYSGKMFIISFYTKYFLSVNIFNINLVLK